MALDFPMDRRERIHYRHRDCKKMTVGDRNDNEVPAMAAGVGLCAF